MRVFGRLAMAGAAGLALFVAVAPALAVLLLGWPGAFHVLATPVWNEAARRSLVLAEASTAIAWPLGIMAAFGLWGARRRHRRAMLSASLLPLLLPPGWSASGLGVAAAFGVWPAGGQMAVLVFGQAVPAACLVLLVMSGFLNRLDPRIAQAAATCGASPGRIRRLVLLPNLVFPLGVAAAAAFAVTLGQTAFAPASLGGLVAQAALRHEPVLAPATLILATMAAAPLLLIGLIWLLLPRGLENHPTTPGHPSDKDALGNTELAHFPTGATDSK